MHIINIISHVSLQKKKSMFFFHHLHLMLIGSYVLPGPFSPRWKSSRGEGPLS